MDPQNGWFPYPQKTPVRRFLGETPACLPNSPTQHRSGSAPPPPDPDCMASVARTFWPSGFFGFLAIFPLAPLSLCYLYWCSVRTLKWKAPPWEIDNCKHPRMRDHRCPVGVVEKETSSYPQVFWNPRHARSAPFRVEASSTRLKGDRHVGVQNFHQKPECEASQPWARGVCFFLSPHFGSVPLYLWNTLL